MRRRFHLTEQEESLLSYDPGFASPMPTSRLDAFFGPDTELRFTEYNAETPAGAIYSDGLAQLFYATPVMGQFLKRYRVIPLPSAVPVMHALLDAFRQWSGAIAQRRRSPFSIERRCRPTANSCLFQNLFQSNGLSCIIADPREVEYRDGKLLAGDYHINLIYKRVLISDIDRAAAASAIPWRGARRRCVHGESLPLQDPAQESLPRRPDRRAQLPSFHHPPARGHLRPHPLDADWSRNATPSFAGCAPVDLVPFILRNRDSLVLKPNDDYGGKGIVLGWLVDDARWEASVQTALRIPYIVQQRVTLPKEPFPSMVEGKLRISDRMFDTAPLIVNGDYVDGCLTRIATDPLLNVTAGGGSTVPTFVIEPR